MGLLVPAPSRAYRTLSDDDPSLGQQRVTWASPAVPVAVYDQPPRDVRLLDLQRVVQLAAQTWSAPSCTALTVPTVTTTGTIATSGDGAVTVAAIRSGWRELGLPSDVGATTDLVFEYLGESWYVTDADVLINDADYAWSANPQPVDASRRDLRAVLTHELGHSLASLAHPCEHAVPGVPSCSSSRWFGETTMFPEYRGTEQSTLAEDDLRGLCANYPVRGCNDVRCPNGAACVEDGACAIVCGPVVCALDQECIDGACVLNSSCTQPPCEPRPMCVESPAQACGAGAPGDACIDDQDCTSTVCDEGHCRLACAANNTCPAPYVCRNGWCEPPAGVFGDLCDTASDCTTSLCLREDEGIATCTRSCARDTDCPTAHQCSSVSDRAVCRRVPMGCHVSANLTRSGAPWIASFLILLGLCLRRRR